MQKTIFIKDEFNWHFIFLYFEFLRSSLTINDAEFNRLFNKLLDYVDKKLSHTVGDDIVDIYVTVEKRINDIKKLC